MANEPNLKTLVPRFRWGNIGPTGGGGLHRGNGYQFYRIVPLDVIEIATGLGITDYTQEGVEAAIGNFPKCLELLKPEKVDRVILGGAPISAQLGRARVLELLATAEKETGAKGDSPPEAVIASMKQLGLTRLAIGSRWTDELNTKLVQFFTDGGIDVVGITKRGQWAREAFGMSFEQGLQTALDVGREAASLDSSAEAIYVAGGAAMALHVIPALEDEIGKPYMTNLSAEVWNGLVGPGVIPAVEGWGQLLASGKAKG